MTELKPVGEWGLSESEARVLSAVIKTGCNKAAAGLLFRSVKTVEFYLASAYQKAGASGAAGRILVLIAFDRHTRGST